MLLETNDYEQSTNNKTWQSHDLDTSLGYINLWHSVDITVTVRLIRLKGHRDTAKNRRFLTFNMGGFQMLWFCLNLLLLQQSIRPS